MTHIYSAAAKKCPPRFLFERSFFHSRAFRPLPVLRGWQAAGRLFSGEPRPKPGRASFGNRLPVRTKGFGEASDSLGVDHADRLFPNRTLTALGQPLVRDDTKEMSF